MCIEAMEVRGNGNGEEGERGHGNVQVCVRDGGERVCMCVWKCEKVREE